MDHQKISDMVTEGEIFKEVSLGEGVLILKPISRRFKIPGYTGYLTIEREVGTQPEVDIRKAVQFIKGFKS